MRRKPDGSRSYVGVARAVVEVGSIIFLFYSNLLMGEFTRSNGAGKTLVSALSDIWTYKNFGIAMGSALVGYVVFEALRRNV